MKQFAIFGYMDCFLLGIRPIWSFGSAVCKREQDSVLFSCQRMSDTEDRDAQSTSTEASSFLSSIDAATDSEYLAGTDAGGSTDTDSSYTERTHHQAPFKSKQRQAGTKVFSRKRKSREHRVATDRPITVSEVASSSESTSFSTDSNKTIFALSWPESRSEYELFAGDVDYYADFPDFPIREIETAAPSTASRWPRPVHLKHAEALRKLKRHLKHAVDLNKSSRSYKFKMAAARTVRAHEITLPKRKNRLSATPNHAIISGANNALRIPCWSSLFVVSFKAFVHLLCALDLQEK